MKKKSKHQLRIEEAHERWMERFGVSKTQLKNREFRTERLVTNARQTRHTSDKIPGNYGKQRNNTYTGDYILGIATMHKSNAIPVTNKETAIEVSQMRRN